MKLMRVDSDVVVEIVEVPDTFDGREATADDYFHAACGFIPHDGRSEMGWMRQGNRFAAPPPAVIIPAPAAVISARKILAAAEKLSLLADFEKAAEKAKPGDRLYFEREADFVADNPKLIRIAASASIDLAKIFDLAKSL